MMNSFVMKKDKKTSNTYICEKMQTHFHWKIASLDEKPVAIDDVDLGLGAR